MAKSPSGRKRNKRKRDGAKKKKPKEKAVAATTTDTDETHPGSRTDEEDKEMAKLKKESTKRSYGPKPEDELPGRFRPKIKAEPSLQMGPDNYRDAIASLAREQEREDAEGGGGAEDGGGGDQRETVTYREHSVGEYLTPRFVFAVFVSGFCSAFQHGYQTGVVNNAHEVLRDWIGSVTSDENATASTAADNYQDSLKVWEWSAFVSAFNIGGLLGSAVIFYITRHHSKKNGLKLNNMSVIVGVILLGFAKILKSYALFLTGRFVVGINAALNAGLAMMYLSEISPISLRGAICSVYPVSLNFAILAANALGTQWALGTEDYWPYLFVIPVAGGITQIVGIAFCPESPKFILIEKGDDRRANRALKWLRKPIKGVDVDEELRRISREGNDEKEWSPTNCGEIFSNAALRNPLRIAVFMMLAQQLTGIASAVYFSRVIFHVAGLTSTEAQISTIIVAAVNMVMTIISLFVVDRAGRKTLMYIGLGGMLLTTTGLVVCLKLKATEGEYPAVPYVSVLCVSGFVVSYAVGPGPIPWFFVNELFAQRARTIANAIANGVNWMANFVVAFFFPQLFLNVLEEDVFFIFIGFQILFLWYVYYEVPETTGRAIHHIVEDFRKSEAFSSQVQGRPDGEDGNDAADGQAGEEGVRLKASRATVTAQTADTTGPVLDAKAEKKSSGGVEDNPLQGSRDLWTASPGQERQSPTSTPNTASITDFSTAAATSRSLSDTLGSPNTSDAGSSQSLPTERPKEKEDKPKSKPRVAKAATRTLGPSNGRRVAAGRRRTK